MHNTALKREAPSALPLAPGHKEGDYRENEDRLQFIEHLTRKHISEHP